MCLIPSFLIIVWCILQDGAEQARLISEFLEVAKKQREEGIMLDYYMEEIFAHCYSHLACIFKVTFEE